MQKKKLITSALPYVNNTPHLGNIIGCVLSADVYARFCRLHGYETLYICATDEYGTATENKAREEGVTPREICDKYHEIHKKVYQHFNISFDTFGRTSNPEHTELTQQIYKSLDEKGLISEEESEQTYCEHDQMFLADRYVEGECPSCGSGGARGDQCDNCGKLLQPTELISPKCKICENTPVTRLTKHLYINLPALEKRLKEYHDNTMERGGWSHNAATVTKAWLENGLMQRPITRDLTWGVPVPREGYENKVFYVWFDAPIGYISATKHQFPTNWKDWWFDPEHTDLVQFMAKDNIPFHTVVFPASLIGTSENWTLMHHINSTEYLNYEDTKFSKSRSIGVFGSDVIESDIPVDLWRFYLLYNRPEKSDTNFTWESFFEDVNSNFIDNIGNLTNRVLVFFHKNFDGLVEEVEFKEKHREFLESVVQEEKEIVELLDKVQLKEVLKRILLLGKMGNRFFHEQEPWATIKIDRDQTKVDLTVLIYLVRDLGILLAPYMPDASERILSMLSLEKVNWDQLGDWSELKGKRVQTPKLLFQKLPKKSIETYRSKFSGIQKVETDPLEAWKDVELTVGEIMEVSPHPSADRLYVEKIDCGEGRIRTIVSGLVKYYKEEELLGKRVIVVTNLATANLRDIDSEGMILAAEKKKKLEVIDAGSSEIGTKILLHGETSRNPLTSLSIDRLLEAKITVTNFEVNIAGKKLLLNQQPIQVSTIEKGAVR